MFSESAMGRGKSKPFERICGEEHFVNLGNKCDGERTRFRNILRAALSHTSSVHWPDLARPVTAVLLLVVQSIHDDQNVISHRRGNLIPQQHPRNTITNANTSIMSSISPQANQSDVGVS